MIGNFTNTHHGIRGVFLCKAADVATRHAQNQGEVGGICKTEAAKCGQQQFLFKFSVLPLWKSYQ